MRDVFVQMPSYCDRQLIPTLLDMIAMARDPGRLRIVVCWQHDEEESLREFLDSGFAHAGHSTDEDNVHHLHLHGANLEILDFHFTQSQGCGWARQTIQGRYRGEAYALQLDAHHRFVAEWDQILIDMLNGLRSVSCKPLLTCHPPSFEPENDPQSRQQLPTQINFNRFSSPGVVSLMSSAIGDSLELKAPVRAKFLAGGFIFSDGNFVRDVPNDGEQFFATEEITMSARAYTHGYDAFHPNIVILWHHYKNKEITRFNSHPGQSDAAATAYAKAKHLLGMDGDPGAKDFGRFGLGRARSLQQYEQYAGISFRHRGLSCAALVEAAGYDLDLPYDVWERSLICTTRAEMRIEGELPKGKISEYSDMSIFVYSSDGRRIFKKNLSPAERDLIADGIACNYTLTFTTSPFGKPSSYSIEAFDRNGERVNGCRKQVAHSETKGYHSWI